MNQTDCSLLLSLACAATCAQAQISPGNCPLTFAETTAPPITSWATLSVAGSDAEVATVTQLDTLVQSITVNSITNPLGTSSVQPPVVNGRAQLNTAGHHLQTRPAGNAYTLLLGTFLNDFGYANFFTLSYDFGALVSADSEISESIPGHQVYWSTTGEAGSWKKIGSLSGLTSTTNVYASIPLREVSWNYGSVLYVLWADDNGPAGTSAPLKEGGYTIDNLEMWLAAVESWGEITNPEDGSTFAEGVPFSVSVNAYWPGGGSATRVDLYTNNALFCTKTNPPWTFVVTNLPIGVHSIYALENLNQDNTYQSSSIQITIVSNVPPTVTIDHPVNGTAFFVGENITNQVSVSDPDNTISRIEFYVDGQLRFSETNPPYRFEYCDGVGGIHTFSAVAVDNIRITNTINILVTNPANCIFLISNGASWNYLHDGSDQGTAWRTLAFNDSGWSNGVAEIGYGDSNDNRPERTELEKPPYYITTYFRQRFWVADPFACTNYTLGLLADDGAVIYLNGMEVFRFHMTNSFPDPVYYTNYARSSTNDGASYVFVQLTPRDLVAGTNIVAVEVHQASATSVDLSFDLMLWGEALARLAWEKYGPGSSAEDYQLILTGALGVSYQLQTSTNLAVWEDWAGLTNASGNYWFRDLNATGGWQRFFRVIRTP